MNRQDQGGPGPIKQDAGPTVNEVMEAINQKLLANQPLLERSLNHGCVIWRRKKGKLEVSLELKF